MYNCKKLLFAIVSTLGIAAIAEVPTAYGSPGDGVDQPRLQVLDAGPRAGSATCASRDRLCLQPGAPSTISAPPAAAAVAGRGAAPGNDAPPRFARVLPTASHRASAAASEDVPWTIEVSGELRHAALAGNALFIVYDAQDEKALAEHEVTALWQARIQAGTTLAARLLLTPEDGFRSGHTYRLRVAQLVAGKQVVLAESSLRLL